MDARKMNWVSAMNRILLIPATVFVFAPRAVCPWLYAAAAVSGNAQDCDRLAVATGDGNGLQAVMYGKVLLRLVIMGL
jgi:hypothetical protein